MIDYTGQYFDRYHILAPIGEGGMAAVYKAYDTRLEREVAIKIIRTDLFGAAVLDHILKRFEREARALARLTHPNIVSVIDYGEYKGAPYLVMEYLPGGTLKGKLGSPMPWEEAVRILLPIAEALDYAHSQKIIHRDVKPSNILMTLRDHPMLSDFGIAKILEKEDAQTLTGTGIGVGTPEYMSPEQWTGQVDSRSDIYSLGVVLYELVTGRKPYIADTPTAILLKQANDPLPNPKQFVPNLPNSLEKIILKVLAKKPENRYQDMQEFVTAMETLLSEKIKTKQAVPELTNEPAEEKIAISSPELEKKTRLSIERDELEKNTQVSPLPPPQILKMPPPLPENLAEKKKTIQPSKPQASIGRSKKRTAQRKEKQQRKARQKLVQTISIVLALLVVAAVIWMIVSSHPTTVPVANVTPTAAPINNNTVAPTVVPMQFSTPPPMQIDVNKQYFATVKMAKGGEFVIQLYPDKAPITVNSFVFLARKGFFNGTTFHRVLEGFMAQGGDPTGTGTGGPGYSFVNEKNDLAFDKPGVVAMANAGPDTNGSQFFIMFGPYGLSEDDYTIFGQVISGMDVVNGLTRRDPQQNPTFAGDAIESVTITEK